jgi:N-dimethylarginine dimethylaminohydrolase
MIHSYNEWDHLREIVVGQAQALDHPDPNVIQEINQDLDDLCSILRDRGVTVHRAVGNDTSTLRIRDRLLVAGNTLIDPAVKDSRRERELEALVPLLGETQPVVMPRGKELVMNATNVSRLGSTWLYLESSSGSRAAGEWLGDRFPDIDIHGCRFDGVMHINQAMMVLGPSTIVLDSGLVKPDQLPRCLDNWQKIWVPNIQGELLVITPDTVIADRVDTELKLEIRNHGFNVVSHSLRHATELNTGIHLSTLDLYRQPL